MKTDLGPQAKYKRNNLQLEFRSDAARGLFWHVAPLRWMTHRLEPRLSIYFSSRNPKKATESTEDHLFVNNNSNVQLNTRICLCFKNITCQISSVNLKMVDSLIVSSDTSTLYGELCWLTWLQNREASGLKQRLIVCVLSVMEWLVSAVAIRILIRTYKFGTANEKYSAMTHFLFSEHLTPLCGSLWLHGTYFEKHCFRVN